MQIEFHYRAKGRVHGEDWVGAVSSYESKELTSHSIDKLRQKIREGIENGSLEEGSPEKGFGYESLHGAVMKIITIRLLEFEGRIYRNEESVIELFGKPEPDLINLDMEIIGS